MMIVEAISSHFLCTNQGMSALGGPWLRVSSTTNSSNLNKATGLRLGKRTYRVFKGQLKNWVDSNSDV